MADKKKSDTASEESERSDEDIAEDAQRPEEDVEINDSEIADSEVSTDTLDGVEDAEIVEEIPAEEAVADATDPDVVDPTADDPEPEVPEGMEAEELAEPVDDADIAELERLDGVEAADSVDESSTASPEPAREPDPDPTRTIEKETVVVERKGAAVPGFLGGAIAAIGLVFAAPYVIPGKFLPTNPQVEETFESQAATIAGLQTEVEVMRGELTKAATTSAVETLKTESETAMAAVAASSAEVKQTLTQLGEEFASNDAVDDVTSQLGVMVGRLTALEKRPIAEATDPASIAAVEAYGRELAELKEQVIAQMAEADDLIKSAAAAADKAVSEAIESSSNAVAEAEAAAKAAEAQAAAEAAAASDKALQASRAQALVSIQVALENGSAFEENMQALDGVAVADALTTAAADGVATLPELREAYTLSARKALNVSRSEATDGSATGRASTWVQNQLGVRSLAPSEGDSPDAVLSRAEAALSESRLTDAITELSGLPDGGQQIMADWVATATARAEALAAADELAASLAAN